RRELGVGVPDEGHAAGHARADVVADVAEHHDDAPGHVLARVVTHALDHGGRPGVAHAEALARRPGDEHLAAGRAVEAGVAREHGGAVVVGRRPDDQAPAGHALPDVVVGLAVQLELDVVGAGGAEALAGRPGATVSCGGARGRS